MISTDRLAEAHYAADDPQFFDEEKAASTELLNTISCLADKIDDAISLAADAIDMSHGNARLKKVRCLLEEAMDIAEAEA